MTAVERPAWHLSQPRQCCNCENWLQREEKEKANDREFPSFFPPLSFTILHERIEERLVHVIIIVWLFLIQNLCPSWFRHRALRLGGATLIATNRTENVTEFELQTAPWTELQGERRQMRTITMFFLLLFYLLSLSLYLEVESVQNVRRICRVAP
jgi:hypothetical protein